MAEYLYAILGISLLVGFLRAQRRAKELAARVAGLELEVHAQVAALLRLERLVTVQQGPPGAVAQTPAVQGLPSSTHSEQLRAVPWAAESVGLGEPAPPASLEGVRPVAEAPVSSDADSTLDAPRAAASDTVAAESPTVAPVPAVGEAPVAGDPPVTAAAPAVPEPPAFDWERWVGVRGAALVGASVLALAGVLFFRYAVENGLIPPAVRVVIGVLAGLGCLLSAEKLRARYGVTGNALAGGGLVILYAAFWAARVLYDLIGMEVAFGLMALTTAAGCLLAVRHAALVIAVLGLVGGFATPLMLSSGSDRPLGLFGYILLLDLGFVLAARKRGWGILLSLALVGTLLIEGAWIVLRMGPERQLLGVGVVALFGAVFAWAASKPPVASESWLRNQLAAVLLPFGFALYFATQARLGAQLVPLTVLLALLVFGAGWVSQQVPGAAWLPLSSAVASVTVLGVWLLSVPLSLAACWQGALCSAGLGLVFQLRSELSQGERKASRAASVAHVGLLTLLVLAALRDGPRQLEPWLSGWLLLAVLASVQARFAGSGGLSLAIAPLLALGLTSYQAHRWWPQELSQLRSHFAMEMGVAVAFQVLALVRRKRTDHAAAALFPAVLLLGLVVTPALSSYAAAPGSLLGASLALGALTLFAATHLNDGRALALGALPLVAAQQAAAFRLSIEPADAGWVLGWLTATVLLVSAWPLLVQARLSHRRWAFYTSALAGPLWFLGLRRLYELAFGSATIGALPVLLGALSLGILWYIRRSGALDAELLRSALAWYAAVALGFLSVAIPLQLDRQWITIGWALESAAVLVLFRRLDHAGLKWLGLGLGAAVSARLVLNPAVLDYAERGLPVLNWLLYTYWVPALALLVGHRALRDLELPRLRAWEYAARQPLGAQGLGLAAILVVFVWINLSVFDAFAEGTRLLVDFERRPTRDLVLSLAWGVYAGVLLTLGMVKRARGPRWLSLGLLILTIGKVFLYDLGRLQDLYQVASLVGLAFSLIAVSLAYQRFVFRKVSA